MDLKSFLGVFKHIFECINNRRMYLISEYGDIISDYCGDYRTLIMQQNNCTSTKVNRYSIAGKLAEKLPYSNPYRDRKSGPFPNLARINDRPIPGSICLKYGDGINNPVVCCCFAQYKMGNDLVPYYMNSPKTDSTYKKKTHQTIQKQDLKILQYVLINY